LDGAESWLNGDAREVLISGSEFLDVYIIICVSHELNVCLFELSWHFPCQANLLKLLCFVGSTMSVEARWVGSFYAFVHLLLYTWSVVISYLTTHPSPFEYFPGYQCIGKVLTDRGLLGLLGSEFASTRHPATDTTLYEIRISVLDSLPCKYSKALPNP
jgi:hypothetical protein